MTGVIAGILLLSVVYVVIGAFVGARVQKIGRRTARSYAEWPEVLGVFGGLLWVIALPICLGLRLSVSQDRWETKKREKQLQREQELKERNAELEKLLAAAMKEVEEAEFGE